MSTNGSLPFQKKTCYSSLAVGVDADNDPNAASPCDYETCVLPDCFCSVDGTLIPGNLEVNQVPQMVIITFDDAVNSENWDLYNKKLFTPTRFVIQLD